MTSTKAALLLLSLAAALPVMSTPVMASPNVQAEGRASWYGPGFHGRKTANGERFNQNALTAAHRTLPFGTMVEVTNPRDGRNVVVRINDRGPFSGNRVIDLSRAAAREIGLESRGVGSVKMSVVGGKATARSAPAVANAPVPTARPEAPNKGRTLLGFLRR